MRFILPSILAQQATMPIHTELQKTAALPGYYLCALMKSHNIFRPLVSAQNLTNMKLCVIDFAKSTENLN